MELSYIAYTSLLENGLDDNIDEAYYFNYYPRGVVEILPAIKLDLC